MLGMLVTVIVVIGLIYVGIVIYQHWLLQKVRLVEKKNKRVQSESLRHDLATTGKLMLSGDSLNQFKAYQNHYEEIHSKAFDVVDRLIQAIERDSRGLNFLKTREEYQKANQAVQKIIVDVKDIKHGLKQIRSQSHSHQQAVVKLARKYRNLHKSLLTKNYIYGPAADQIQKYLSRVKSLYNNFAHLTKVGNQEAADRVLKRLLTKVSVLELCMKTVPVLYKNLATIYPKQINEIKHGYHYLLQSGYQFPEHDVGGAIKFVKAKVKKAVGLLKGLNLSQAKSNCHWIENMVNQLYDSMAREIDAKRKVNQDVDVVTEYIAHAQKQNYALMTELRRLSKNYDLNHDEVGTTQHLARQLAEIDAVHQKDLDAIAENSVIYSDVLAHQQKAEKQLGDIESRQRQINDSVYDLNREEAGARNSIRKFGLDLHNLHRRLRHLNLPGIPKDYADYYNVVFDEMKSLSKKINQVKISMDDINKRLVTIRTDMSNLREKTQQLIDNASLSEQMRQYSNRYRNSYQSVAEANAKAQILFDKNYQYTESLRLIASAIDQVEPGASKRIKANYYRNRQAQM